MKTKILMLGIILSIMTISCSKKDTDSSTISEDELVVNTDIDVAIDDVSNIIETQVELTSKTTIANPEPNTATGCPTITRSPAFFNTQSNPVFPIIPEIDQTVTKKIDFGAGCLQPNGNTLRGILYISFVYNPSSTTRTVTYIFENFYHNSKKMNGSKTFTRIMTVGTPTNPSHPFVTMNMDMLITLADGRFFTRKGTRTREITAGYLTPSLNDNEYEINGEWTTTFTNTSVQTSTITSPLLIKLSCSNSSSPISKGIIKTVRNSNTAFLDFGDGSCDNNAVYTLNGVSFPITLRK